MKNVPGFGYTHSLPTAGDSLLVSLLGDSTLISLLGEHSVEVGRLNSAGIHSLYNLILLFIVT